MKKKRICIMCFGNIAWDRRILRQIIASKEYFEVDVIAYKGLDVIDGVNFYPIELGEPPVIDRYSAYLLGILFPSFYKKLFWKYRQHQEAYKILLMNKYDLIHANDWDTVPVAVRASKETGSKVLFDAHENYLEQYAENKLWKLLIAPFRKYLLKEYSDISGLITVSKAFQDFYLKKFGWNGEVVMSAADYVDMPFNPVSLDRIELVHHGIALKQRHIEKIIDVVALLGDHYHLNLILLPGGNRENCLEDLKKYASNVAKYQVSFLDPIPPKELIPALNKFDIGIPFMHFKQGNYFYTLPNKFFDIIMAGLAVSVSPQPMMSEIVDKYQIGIISDDQSPKAMANKIKNLSLDDINVFKRNSLELAKTMNSEKEMGKLMSIYMNLLDK